MPFAKLQARTRQSSGCDGPNIANLLAVWLASEMSVISAMAEHLAWGVCDYMAKAVFSSQLWQVWQLYL